MSVTVAGGALWGMIGVLLFALLIVLDRDLDSNYVYVCGFVAGAIAYFSVLRDDKYLLYFKKYEHWSRVEKIKYSCATLASVAATCLFFYLALIN